MDEASLVKMSLLCAVMGLIAVSVVSLNVTGGVIGIGDITPEFEGRVVKVCGNITSKFTSQKGHVFFTLYDGEAMDVVVFNNTAHKVLAVDKGDSVCITGDVGIYKGELEVILRELHD